MIIGRTIPPAAAPLGAVDLCHGLVGLAASRRALERLEQEIAQQLRVRHVFLVSSGTAALTLTLKALAASSSRTGVVVPGYTCFSVPGAVVHAGLRPVPCDIDAATFDFDHSNLAQTIDDSTLCVIAHHLFGVPSDVARTRALCHSRGVLVVEDAAQGLGVTSKGVPAGTIGDVGIFSFGRGKSVTAGGGGAIVTNSDELADAIRGQCDDMKCPAPLQTIADFLMVVAMAVFIRPALYWLPAALPFLRLGETFFPAHVTIRRMSGMQAGLLRCWQRRLRVSNRVGMRTAVALGKRLGIAWPAHPYLRLPIYASSPAEKRALLARSRRLGLGLSGGYPLAVDQIPQLTAWVSGVRCPRARHVAAHLLTLPVHHWLRTRDRRAICECLRRSGARRTYPPQEMQRAS
jgi:dTDP-4-amino-4,6-dideoxygalactose transaminase